MTVADVQFLHLCARTLAGLDSDHATEANGIGFSANDTAFGHRIAQIPVSDWTPQITVDAFTCLKRYRVQLQSHGLDIDHVNIDLPTLEPSTDRREALRLIGYEDGAFTITFPYSKTLVEQVKAIDGRRFDPDKKRWTAPLRSRDAVMQFAERHGFTVATSTNDAPTTPVDDEPLGGTLDLRDAKFIIKFPYNREAVSDVKEINGRRWDVENRAWIAPLSSVRQVRDFANKYGLQTVVLDEVPDSDPVVEPTISHDKQSFIIRFPYDRDLVQQVRDIPTAQWDSHLGAWRVAKHADFELLQFAEATTAVVEDSSVDLMERAKAQVVNIEKSRATDADLQIPTLNGTLLPFQRAGVLYALEALGYQPQPDGTWTKT